ncbi:hypothetical protein BP6252_07536 [Coleophoma cylindrospora]|uniref:Uncharacterized protein n=1 Tax=Coleophoma cylindrospora TaxID=1849047 RepID=A0A3D8RA92_9HELO|nr:hypothetical protein BP6252_07536 [Coleophoma cylindrospora]
MSTLLRTRLGLEVQTRAGESPVRWSSRDPEVRFVTRCIAAVNVLEVILGILSALAWQLSCNYSMEDLLDDVLIWRIRTTSTLVALFVAISVVRMAYMLEFWLRLDYPRLRSSIFALLGIISTVLVSCAFSLTLGTHPNRNAASSRRPDIPLSDINTCYDHFRNESGMVYYLLGFSLLESLLQAYAISIWLWLLPPHETLPHRYEPVIRSTWMNIKENEQLYMLTDIPNESIARTGVAALTTSTSFATIFEEHERLRTARWLQMTRPEMKAAGTFANQRCTSGPKYDPKVRYWAVTNAGEIGGQVILGWHLTFLVLSTIFEVAFLGVVVRDKFPCTW